LIPIGQVKYWDESFRRCCGVKSLKRSDMKGKTDKRIVYEMCRLNGIDPKQDNNFLKIFESIETVVSEQLTNKKLKVMPGIIKLLEALKQKDVIIGVLTGNLKGKAKAKLSAAGIWNYIEIGSYGDMSLNRSDLVPIAIAEFKTKFKSTPDEIYIIGDTVLDIKCAKDNDCKCLAVGCGEENLDVLKSHDPDYLIANFDDTDKIIGFLK